jgi:hypothetical protein
MSMRLAVFSLLLLGMSSAHAAFPPLNPTCNPPVVLFVSSSRGDDGNAGTQHSSPVQTLSAALAKFVSLSSSTSPMLGSRVLLAAGDVFDIASGVELRPGWDSGPSGFGANHSCPFVLGAFNLTTGNELASGVDPPSQRPVLRKTTAGGNILSIRSTGPGSTPVISAFILIRDVVLAVSGTAAAHATGPTGFYCNDGLYGIPHDVTLQRVLIAGTGHGITDYCDRFRLVDSVLVDNHNFGPGTSGHSQGLYVQANDIHVKGSRFERNGKVCSPSIFVFYLSSDTAARFEPYVPSFSGTAGSTTAFTSAAAIMS